jgi:hypothetical protein
LDLLHLLTILVENSGGSLSDAKVLDDLWVFLDIDGVSITGGSVFGSEAVATVSGDRHNVTAKTYSAAFSKMLPWCKWIRTYLPLVARALSKSSLLWSLV